ncbi:hypothetical protein [Ammoniphilus sp. YIM 78166]|uniref:hypothetical protein n=1 Tax=Ammoniphilus sp. YIM 78166 TaxID=1644106 RepID=UPI00106F9DC2|nr:hypothetical protein [Ammoniphilus sp. YIM 78166]
MKKADREEAIQQMISLAMQNPTLEQFGEGCFDILKKFGAFKALEKIGCKVDIVPTSYLPIETEKAPVAPGALAEV